MNVLLLNYKIIEHVKNRLKTNKNGHDYAHAMRVVKNIQQIINLDNLQVNQKICLTAGLVHDVIDHKVAVDIQQEVKMINNVLLNCNYSNDEIAKIMIIINNMSYSKGLELLSLEGQIVQDADRLDALGAYGITRTLIYANEQGHQLYCANDFSNETAIGHFHQKLYKLPATLNTKAAQRLSIQRIKFMQEFEQQIIDEFELKS